MAKTITITDLTFNECRLWAEVDADGVTHLYVGVGYKYTTSDGSPLTGSRTMELTGARKTTAVNFFTNLKADLLAADSI